MKTPRSHAATSASTAPRGHETLREWRVRRRGRPCPKLLRRIAKDPNLVHKIPVGGLLLAELGVARIAFAYPLQFCLERDQSPESAIFAPLSRTRNRIGTLSVRSAMSANRNARTRACPDVSRVQKFAADEGGAIFIPRLAYCS
jgi:hypothetical protein